MRGTHGCCLRNGGRKVYADHSWTFKQIEKEEYFLSYSRRQANTKDIKISTT
jgi:hypothetical protein